MEPGQILFLNGTSSSGKSSIALALQSILHTPYLHVASDTFATMLPPRYWDTAPAHEHHRTQQQLVSGYHHAITALASVGNNLIVDHVLQEEAWLRECVELLATFAVIFVGVHCSLIELEQRERTRGDRIAGLAAWQFERVHVHSIYDIEVDSGRSTPLECAKQIEAYLIGNTIPNAFEQLRVQFAQSH